jgi:DNA-binding response OmpR family regulator
MSRPVVGLVVADHQRAFAEGLAIILDGHDDLAVLGVAHDAPQTLKLAGDHRPAVLLLDAELPGGGPVRTSAAVRAASPATRVLLMAAQARHRAVAAVVASGADGLVTRGVSSQQVVAAIHAAVAGRRVIVTGGRPPELGRAASVRSLACWPRAARPSASPGTGGWRRAPSARTCRTCWVSSTSTASWRRPRSPGSTGS